MEKEFKNIEQEFERLKREFRQGDISRPQFIDGLKKLRFKDEEGRFWMVGAQSGKWYYYDGETWIQSNPPSLQEGKAICIHCGFENRLEAEVCARCGENLAEKDKYCPDCGSRIEDPQLGCPYCSQPEVPGEAEEGLFQEKRSDYSVVRFLNPLSSLIFFGTVGIFVGLILGAFAGTTDLFQTVVILLPAFFKHIQGTLLGGIMYAVLGGILGLIFLGVFGFLFALFYNFVSSFVGGIKIRLD
jgi:hypothetical protein